MIDIQIRDRNNIVTLSVPGKTPIRSSGGTFFYSSMELLCISLGSCFGKELVRYCSFEKINPRVFESIKVSMKNYTPYIIVSHPKDFDPKHIEAIESIASTCKVAKMLVPAVGIRFVENTISTEDLVDETKNTGCCGGGHSA